MPGQTTSDALVAKTKRQYEILSDSIGSYGPGGREVLSVAFEALREHHARGKALSVELVDLWTESLQEGSSLFDKPEKLWGATTAEETLDLIGQTTIGPWQITDWNIRDNFGGPYGVQKNWDLRALVGFCRTNPVIQAKMAADYIQRADELYGKRTPHAIQSYFWLEAFVKGEIGGGAWDNPVLVQPDPSTRKLEITPEKMRNTGFYGKQILLGWKGQPHGLLYWLWVLKDEEGIRTAVRGWKDQKKWIWDAKANASVPTSQSGGFGVTEDDLKYCSCHPEFSLKLKEIIRNGD